jgi:glycosyltransferase involved in cell wall biosynthesis
MCTCNGAAYLREQLESIAAQTVLPEELIVSDDASTDGTVEIVRAFKEKSRFPVTIAVNENRLGVCRNFESAIRNCAGAIIFLADQDDVWLPSKIAQTLAVFQSHPHCGYVFSNADLIDENGDPIGRDLWTSIEFGEKQQIKYAGTEQLNIMLRRFTLPYGTTMAFRAAFIPQLVPFECRFSRAIVHDGWISLFLSSLGAYGVAIPEPLVKYRQHGKQLASAGEPLAFGDLVRIKRSRNNEQNLQFVDLLEHLAGRLLQLEPLSKSVLPARKQLLEKARHVRARVHANSSHGMERLRTVIIEALSGRYGRYSRSLKSVVKDLVTD